MLSNLYLAMTEAEIGKNPPLSPQFCFMACHFAPYGRGLSNIPHALPAGAILMVNDSTPVNCHDPQLITQQLLEATGQLQCSHLVLDFQRPGVEATAQITESIVGALPCPVIVSAPYAASLSCPVLLPPLPLHRTLADYLAPWEGREIWIEAALEAMTITVTEKGSRFASCEPPEAPLPHFDGALLCHYGLELQEDAALFTLHRTRSDLEVLMEDSRVTGWLGLYQELKK